MTVLRSTLFHASHYFPSNQLLRTFRRVYSESKGLLIESQRFFWSQTTFTLNFVDRKLLDGTDTGAVDSLKNPRNEQVGCMARIVIVF